jgi:hypothetical protein
MHLAGAELVRSLMPQGMFLDKPLRLPLREFIPSTRFENEAAFSGKWPRSRQFSIQTSTESVKVCGCLWRFSPADNFKRTHFF